MNTTHTSLPVQSLKDRFDPDRIGIVASVLCAIHCAIAPVLLILAPTFGRWWAHPASHWLVALLVVPLAGVMVARGFRKHRKRWIVASGGIGIVLVLLGATIPYIGTAKAPKENHHIHEAAATAAHTSETEAKEHTEELHHHEEVNPDSGSDCCEDGCCPTLVTGEQNQTRLQIPPASIATTLGGLALILTHVGNVCFCTTCRTRKQAHD